MATFGMVKAVRARFTKVDACGMPIAGPRSRITTGGLITLTGSPVMRDAEELEQTNGEGRVCISSRTPPERKRWNVGLELCKVNTCLYNMVMDWAIVTDYAGNAIGFDDAKSSRSDRGVAVELWTGVGDDEECDTIPTTDDILVNGALASSLSYGYVLYGVIKEFGLGADLDIGAKISTFKLNGISATPSRWGLGPYNVQATDAQNTPGRMLKPIKAGSHLRVMETTIAPPDADEDCCPLILPSPYYGPTAAEIAPAQPACDAEGSNEEQLVTITGTPTAGTFNLMFIGQPTTALDHDVAAADMQTALEAVSTIGEGNVTVTGSPGGPYTVEFIGELAATNLPLMTVTDALTGGTSPEVVVTEAQAGGVY